MSKRLTIEEAFHAARQRTDPAERAAYLDGACGNDVAMRAKVEELLKADAEAGEFLQVVKNIPTHLPSSAPGAATLGDQVGQTIDRYKLLQQIGEGGFGVVYVAEQREPVRRRVALKIIKLGMDTRQVIARFEAERQALAMMDHPNIAIVLDAGSTETGRPYFVMEYIKGVPILEYCDTARLSIGARLELFGRVCQAIQHAHQKGVIHRDIKPSNVLVTLHDGVPVPKVIDFGIAKATSAELTTKTVFTQHRQMIGTLTYMSPEQAEMSGLDIDTRSDIYSLGVLLYELLTGTTPFAQAELLSGGLSEMMRLIREVDPHKPSTRLSGLGETGTRMAQQRRADDARRLGRTLEGELDWVVMKCLEKDRTRRYETANGLAMDVQRYLAGEAVLAAPPSTRYRIRKFVRRYRAQVIAAAMILFLLLAGITGTSWGLWEATRARTAESERAEGERLARLDAERKRAEAETNLGYARKGNEILGSIFADLDPNQDYATVAELRNALKANLAKAAADLEGSAIGDPLAVAEMQLRLGRSLTALGAAEQAIPLQTIALDTRRTQLGPDHVETLAAMSALAMAHWETGDLDAALPLAEEALRRGRATLGADAEATFTSINNLASVYWKAGRTEEAIPLFEELLELQTATLGRDHPETAQTIGNLGVNYKDAGRLDEAIPLLEEAHSRFEAGLGPDHFTTLIAATNLAQGYDVAGRPDDALPLYEATVDRTKARLGPDHPHTLKTLKSLAYAYWKAGRFDASVPLWEDELKRLEAKLGPDDPEALEVAANLGGNYLGSGRPQDAIALLERVLPVARDGLGPEHATTQLGRTNLASAYWLAGRLDASIRLYEEALALMRSRPETDVERLQTATSLGIAYRDAGRLDRAIPLLEKTLDTERATLGSDHPATLRCMLVLGIAHRVAGRPDLAVTVLEGALEHTDSTLGTDSPDTFATMHELGVAYYSTRRLDRSIPLFEALLSRQEAKLGRHHPETLNTIANLGSNLCAAGRFEPGIPLLEEAQEASKTNPSLRWVGKSLLLAYVRAAHRVDPADPDRAARTEVLLHELLAEERAAHPKDSLDLAVALNPFGVLLLHLKSWQEAESLMREVLRIHESAAPDDWRTFCARSMLGEALVGQDKFAEAEPLLLDGYRGMKEREAGVNSPDFPRCTRDALARIVRLYEATGNEREAAKWKERMAGK